MSKSEKLKYTETELQRLRESSTRVYLKNVMEKLFREKWEEHLTKLLAGDRRTLDLCARYLAKNLDFFPLLHTLCLVTSQRFDMTEKERTKAADSWMCWYNQNKDQLVWNIEYERWEMPPPP